MQRGLIAALVVALLLPVTQVQAQFWDKLTNPTIKVDIRHPPGLGIQVNKVAFGPAKGEAAQQFIDSLTEHFVGAKIAVVERQQLESLLVEHNFSLSGYVDSASAAEMGKILGPAVLLFVDVPRHRAEQKRLYNDWKDYKGNLHRTHISRTQAFARGSVKAVDLATGKIFAAKTLTAQPAMENKAEECCAEFPPDEELLDMAMSQLVGEASRLFLPWTEVAELYFFDDKDCNLNTAQSFMKSGNVEAALQQSLINLETCKKNPKAKDKNLYHANYNVGMGYFATGKLDAAIEYLNAAQQIKPADINVEAIANCTRAKALAAQMQQVEQRMALDTAMGAKRVESAPAGAAAKAPAAPEKAGSSVEERLQKLDALLKKGLITKPEYDKKKAELLKEL